MNVLISAGKYATEILPLLLPNVRAQNDSLRADSLQAFKNLVIRCDDVTVLEKMLQELIKLVKGEN